MADENSETSALDKETLITLTSDIVAAHVSRNSVSVDDVATLIGSTFEALAGLGSGGDSEEPRPEPAVSIRASVKQDHIVCLEDGKKMKMLKRHLKTDHGMTPEEYRKRWDLPSDYPMVAPDYAEKRRELAKKIGLGRKPTAKTAEAVKPAAAKKAPAKKAPTKKKAPRKTAAAKGAPARKKASSADS